MDAFTGRRRADGGWREKKACHPEHPRGIFSNVIVASLIDGAREIR